MSAAILRLFPLVLCFLFTIQLAHAQPRKKPPKVNDARNTTLDGPQPTNDPIFEQYGIYQKTAPRAAATTPEGTSLPLPLAKGNRVALIGNSLFEHEQNHGHFETTLYQSFPEHDLIIRNLAWSGDTPSIQPRPANFADTVQHLTHEKVDVIIAAYGYNESFAGPDGAEAFRKELSAHVSMLKSRAFNGKAAPRIVLVSPIPNENVDGVAAGDLNNVNIKLYAGIVKDVAADQKVGYVDLFTPLLPEMASPGADLTINGAHLNDRGYGLFAKALHRGLFDKEAQPISEPMRKVVQDKNRQYFRRYRPVNTFYYTGDRNRSYGYLDFLPAMRNFDILVANRESHIHKIAKGEAVPETIDDSNLPPLPKTKASRGANRWMSAEDEKKAFIMDDRFDVNLFAGEEEFPEIAAPIQMRWDSKGRLWVSTSKTYPHVYPGNEPEDQLVVLEDTDGDGKADKSTVFAEGLHIPLSFEFGDGGVYVSEQPNLTFLKDTDGDGKADVHRTLLTGFGTEDSHHSLHDFTWTPDGDLLFRESIFHHSQVETPYGPVRQQNSGWFRYEPRTHRLTSMGTYHSTNPWGVTFDDWGQHMASHPIYAEAFHSLDPPYPNQHPRPAGLQAYSGTCGQEFIDFNTFPEELAGHFVKVRYKPTNRLELLKWKEGPFGFEEEYVSDILFSKNLSFIPVDLRFGPRGALYICDWYNPIKGHAQYSLRDERRDRHSGRIWRITAKGKKLQDPPPIAEASIAQLIENLKRPEYRFRYWSRRELRERDADKVETELNTWVAALDPADARYRHHQLEAIFTYRTIDRTNHDLLRELLSCDEHLARAAATKQLRYWHLGMADAAMLLKKSARDVNGIVRMQAAIAASWIGSREAFEALILTTERPAGGHLAYAIQCSINSVPMQKHWRGTEDVRIRAILKRLEQSSRIKEPNPTASEAQFDTNKNLKTVRIGCIPERMRFTVTQFVTTPGQPLKLIFVNPDATDHNMVFVKPGSLAEVGMAANEMAKDPKNANSDFIPADKRNLIMHASKMIGPTRKSRVHVFRFKTPTEPGIYPYVCTFPGHWVIMKGAMIVASTEDEAKRLLEESQPKIVKEWTLADFADDLVISQEQESAARGMQAFVKARCNQCHKVAGHGVNLGPDLTKLRKELTGKVLLKQLIEPSAEIAKNYQPEQFLMTNGQVISGVVKSEDDNVINVMPNLLTPDIVTKVAKKQIDERFPSKISPMPTGMLNTLTRPEIMDLLSFLEQGGFHLPGHLKHGHGHDHKEMKEEKPKTGKPNTEKEER